MSRPSEDSAPSADQGPELIDVDQAGIGATVAALTADDLEPAGRRRLLGRLVGGEAVAAFHADLAADAVGASHLGRPHLGALRVFQFRDSHDDGLPSLE